MVPFAKDRVGADAGTLGGLLLCLGAGSLLAMAVAGALSTRFGTRAVILGSSTGLTVFLPLLGIAPTIITHSVSRC